MVAGVNGSGKTTSIGKLAKWLQGEGRSVMLAAGDDRGRLRSACLANAAVATSGDAFQHVEIDGVRYSHIVNPRVTQHACDRAHGDDVGLRAVQGTDFRYALCPR